MDGSGRGGGSPGTGHLKEEHEGARYQVIVKEEPELYHVKEEPKCESGATCVSETDACMYADHVIKDEFVLRPELILQLNKRNSICGESRRDVEVSSPEQKTVPGQNIFTDILHHTAKANTYVCDSCGQTFLHKHTLIDHVKTHLREESEESNIFIHEPSDRNKKASCKICNKRFRKRYLKTHERIHTGEKPYACEVCKKEFAVLGNLKRHKLSHTEEMPYSCEICRKSFTRSTNLKTHKLSHKGVKPYTCEVCKKGFTQLGSLKSHVRTHTGEKPYCCTVCNKQYRQRSALNYHKITHTGQRPYSCEICEKSFVQLSALNVHKVIHTRETSLSCGKCKKNFGKLSSFEEHKHKCEAKSVHEKFKFENRTDPCRVSETGALAGQYAVSVNDKPECKNSVDLYRVSETGALAGQDAVSVKVKSECESSAEHGVSEKDAAGLYVNHVIKEELVLGPDGIQQPSIVDIPRTSSAPLSCEAQTHTPQISVATTNNKLTAAMSVPSNTEHESTPPQGTDTDTLQAAKKNIKENLSTTDEQTTTSKRRYSCDICKKAFTQSGSLTIHKRIHTGDKPYSCEVCKKKFTALGTLNNHKTVHMEIKAYSCKLCKKEFKLLSSLKNHERNHTDVKPFSCEICRKKFSQKNHLKNHEKTHTGVKPYPCEICKKQFTEKSALRVHNRIHTGEKPYSCEICKRQFRQKGNLKEHTRTHAADRSKVLQNA